ncbi:MAG: hypothetical protein OEM27_07575 [Nitrospinota bacterium]|nr:hypothetical protein [Nitrospinota bacterium]
MHEVRVYDSSGALKKVISEKTLKARADRQILFPGGYAKGKNKAKPQIIPAKKSNQTKLA